MHKTIVTGYLGKDAAIKSSANGDFITFTVANTRKFTVGSVEHEETVWYNCLYAPKSTNVAQYLKKGTKVLVEGRPSWKTYDKQGGGVGIDVSLQISSLDLLTVAGDQTAQQAPVRQPQPERIRQQPEPVTAGNDDLPF